MSGESRSHRSSDWTGCTGGIVEVESRDEVEVQMLPDLGKRTPDFGVFGTSLAGELGDA
jgi:hypothetical protein